MCALRRVLQEAKKLKLISKEEYKNTVDLPPIRVPDSLPGRALKLDEIKALITVCEEDITLQGIRDSALIAILRGLGLRRDKVAKLLLEDFDVEEKTVRIINAKGGKNRLVYLSEKTLKYLDRWLDVRGDEPGALLCPIRKGGRIEYRCMSGEAVYKIVNKRVEEAGLEKLTPHDFRRTFFSDLFDAGFDLVTIQQMGGHSSPVTTAKYDRRGDETKRKAFDSLEF